MEKKLENLTKEELQKEVKNRKFFLGLFLCLVLVMAITSVITIFKKEIGASTYLPLAFLPMVLIFWNNYKNALKELNSRK